MRTIKTLGLLAGVIGGGWAARALHGGYDVLAYDIKPEMEAVLMRSLNVAAEGLAKLTEGMAVPPGHATTDLEELASGADFIRKTYQRCWKSSGRPWPPRRKNSRRCPDLFFHQRLHAV